MFVRTIADRRIAFRCKISCSASVSPIGNRPARFHSDKSDKMFELTYAIVDENTRPIRNIPPGGRICRSPFARQRSMWQIFLQSFVAAAKIIPGGFTFDSWLCLKPLFYQHDTQVSAYKTPIPLVYKGFAFDSWPGLKPLSYQHDTQVSVYKTPIPLVLYKGALRLTPGLV